MKNKRIVYLSDDKILTYSRDHVLTEWRDADISGRWPRPYKNGVYDTDIFGSMFTGQCLCGLLKEPSDKPCHRCKTRVLDIASASKRFARIELPVKYLNSIHLKSYCNMLKSMFPIEFDFKFQHDNKLIDALYYGQWSYDETDQIAVVKDHDYTDPNQCSFEGIELIAQKYFPQKYNLLKQFTNYYVLVTPIPDRNPSFGLVDGVKKLANDSLTTAYKNIIYAVQVYYKNTYPTLKDVYSKVMLNASLRMMVTKLLSNASEVFATSKANITRTIQGHRLTNSGRATIVPAPDLKVDEVAIPRHLMYETCREEFIQYLMDKMGVNKYEATTIWRTRANDKEIQDLFTQYIDGDGKDDLGKYVMINRAPTLYELGIMACKVRLTNDYAMRLPMGLCVPFGGDFDGDAMTFYAIPKAETKNIIKVMNPRNLIYFKKNHQPLFLPTHEILKGLILGTRLNPVKKRLEFKDEEEAFEYWKKNRRTFKFQDEIIIDGEVTSLGRERFSKFFGKDINAYLNDGKWKNLDGKNIIPLYSMLQDFDDRTNRIQQIQEFATQISTLSGTTALTVDEMYYGFDNKRLKEIRDVENNDKLSDAEKEVKIRNLYGKYVKEESDKIATDPEKAPIKLAIEDSARAKFSQFLDMTLVPLNTDTTGKLTVANTTIANGMSPRDYTNLAIENRASQDIKIAATPESGYTTRQFIFVVTNYVYSTKTDPTNKGILIPERDAVGRTTVDGKIVPRSNSDKLIRIRSIVTSEQQDPYLITKDMLTNLFVYADGSRCGMSMISSMTENLTQAGLALKHGGHLFNLDPQAQLIAPEDCTVQLTDNFINLITNSGKRYEYPKPLNFTQCISENNQYKKGDLIGEVFHKFTPAYRLNCVEKLMRAQAARADKAFMRNKVIEADCYCVEDGTIHYIASNRSMMVQIGKYYYNYSPESMYQFPEGAFVKRGERICSGVLSVDSLIQKNLNYVETFYIYRKQVKELLSIADELIEFIYSVLVKCIRGQITVRSVIQTVKSQKSFYTSTAFGYATQLYRQLTPEGIDWVDDSMSRVLLPLLSNDLTNE